MCNVPRMAVPKANREDRIFIRLSKDEKTKFEKLALERHTTVSELARQLLHKEAEKKAA